MLFFVVWVSVHLSLLFLFIIHVATKAKHIRFFYLFSVFSYLTILIMGRFFFNFYLIKMISAEHSSSNGKNIRLPKNILNIEI